MKILQKNIKLLNQTKNWLKENKKAIAEFNKRVSKNGHYKLVATFLRSNTIQNFEIMHSHLKSGNEIKISI